MCIRDRENNENKDPGEIIIDEFLGQSIPIYLYEVSHGTTKEGYEVIIFFGTLRTVIFALFEYVIKPKLNTLDEPLTEVIELDKSPPVQDSANEIVSFFLINFLTSLLAKFFIIKRNF